MAGFSWVKRALGGAGVESEPATAAPAPVPAADALAPDAAAPAERRAQQRTNAPPGTRVLLIDDSPTIVAALGKMLRSAGYVTVEAGDAERGLELARTRQPALIFLDIILPGMNGFAALRALRRDPVTRDIPVVMISGNEAATEQFYVERIGADDFMKKPFSRSEVFARIERLLDAQRVPRRPGRNGAAAAPVPPPQAAQPILVRPVELARDEDAGALVDLLDHYARDASGGGRPLPDEVRTTLVPRLQQRPGFVAFLAWQGTQAVGLLNAFEGFSTFAARPLLNVHDIVVHHGWRGRGVGRSLLHAAESEARRRGCCKLTLEVLARNAPARALYASAGFTPCSTDPDLGGAVLLQRLL